MGSSSSSPSALKKKKKKAWLVVTDWLWLFLIFEGQMPALAAAAVASVLSSVLFIMFMYFTSGKQPNIWTCSYIIQHMKELAVPAFSTFISKQAWHSLFCFFKRRRRCTRLYFQTFFPALKSKLLLAVVRCFFLWGPSLKGKKTLLKGTMFQAKRWYIQNPLHAMSG